jgi:hypothetical protein
MGDRSISPDGANDLPPEAEIAPIYGVMDEGRDIEGAFPEGVLG